MSIVNKDFSQTGDDIALLNKKIVQMENLLYNLWYLKQLENRQCLQNKAC